MPAVLNKTKEKSGILSQKKLGKKISLSLHIMPHGYETKDTRVFSWLVAGVLILISLIIFIMIYVQ